MAISTDIEKLERRWQDNPTGLMFAPLAEAYRKAGDAEHALEILSTGLAKHPEYVPALIVRGRCHLDNGNLSEAEAAFQAALERDPVNSIALRGVAEVFERSGRIEPAIERLEYLLEVDRGDQEARAVLERLRQGTLPESPPERWAPPAPTEPAADRTAPVEQAAGPAPPTASAPAADPTGEQTSRDVDAMEPAAAATPEDREEPLVVPAEFQGFVVPEQSATVEAVALPAAGGSDLGPAADGEDARSPASADSVPESLDDTPAIGSTEAAPDEAHTDRAPDAPEPSTPDAGGFSSSWSRWQTWNPAVAGGERGPGEPGPEAPAEPFEEEAPLPAAVEARAVGDRPADAPPAERESEGASAPEDAPDPEGAGVEETAPVWTPAQAAPEAVGGAESEPEETMADGARAEAPPAGPTPPPLVDPAAVTEPVAETEPVGEPEQVRPSGAEGVFAEAAEEPTLIITESMAELFLRQGHRDLALAVYRQLSERAPGAEHLREAIGRLESEVQARQGGGGPEAPQTQYAASATGGTSVEQVLQAVLEAPPPGGTAAVLPPAVERGPHGTPTRESDRPLALTDVFGRPGPQPGPVTGAAEPAGEPAPDEPSYDEFFGTPGGGAEAAAAPPAEGDQDDLRQFNDWLMGLKR